MMLEPISVSWAALAAPATLLVTAAVALLVGVVRRDDAAAGPLTLVGLAVAGSFVVRDLWAVRVGELAHAVAFDARWRIDAPSAVVALAIVIGAALSTLVLWDRRKADRLDQIEVHPLILLASGGAMVMAYADDVLVLLLGLEILSLAVYALSAWRTADRSSEEAGMKYFLLGAFASAILVYGMALTYGATGAFDYAGIAAGLQGAPGALGWLGATMIVAGLAFKVSLAPFHQWAPDVYTGAPMPVTTFMSVVVKAAAFAALVRIFHVAWPFALPSTYASLAVLVAVTLVVGNLGALMQGGVKRMLAYSAIAHAGYLGLAVLAAGIGSVGLSAVAWYALAYTFMNAGAFAVTSVVASAGETGARGRLADRFDAWRGLGRVDPGLASAMTLFMAGLAGFPLLAGFFGKVLVISAALEAGWTRLAVIAVLAAVVGVAYYFRLVYLMWFTRTTDDTATPSRSPATRVAIVMAAAGTVAMGLFPSAVYDLVHLSQTVVALVR